LSGYRFKSIEDAAWFLGLPPERNVMESRLKMMEYARKFRGYT
jgi:hypothetical protein